MGGACMYIFLFMFKLLYKGSVASHCYSGFLDILAIKIEVTNELECNMLSNMMLLICCRKIGILF